MDPNTRAPAPTPTPTPVSPPRYNSFSMPLILGVAAFLLLYAAGITFGVKYYLDRNKKPQTPYDSPSNTQSVTSLSGVIGLNGTAPTGATVTVGIRKSGEKDFSRVVPGIAAFDGAVWNWDAAEKGTAYEVQATLYLNGQKVGLSPVMAMVAPADSENLEINVAAPPAAAKVLATISGSFNLNGYIPTNATLSISARAQGSSFSQVLASLPAVDNGTWAWTGATENTVYDIQATLVVNGQNAAQSQIQHLAAPATNELLTINSSLKPPAPTTVPIGGQYNINGVIPSGSTLSLGVRQSGSNSPFTMVGTNIQPVDGLAWTWNQAQSGTTYDIQAYVIQNGNTVSSSSVLTVSAPATGEILTINAQSQPAAPPSNSLLTSCTSKNSSNQWQVRFTTNNNSVMGTAKQYQLTAGTSSGDNSLVNVILTPPNPGQAQDYTSGFIFNDGQTYFSQWAYATCPSCGTFSKNSPTIQFSCTTPSSSPVPSATNAPSATTVPSATAAPSSTTAPTNTAVPTAIPPSNTPVPTLILPTATSTPGS